MTRFLRLSRWLSLLPAAVFVAGAFVIAPGCGETKTEETVEVHPDVDQNKNAMTEFMKKNPKFGEPGGPGTPK